MYTLDTDTEVQPKNGLQNSGLSFLAKQTQGGGNHNKCNPKPFETQDWHNSAERGKGKQYMLTSTMV